MSMWTRLQRLAARPRPRNWPRKPLALWSDAELNAALDAVDPEFRDYVKAMTDEELDEALVFHGVL